MEFLCNSLRFPTSRGGGGLNVMKTGGKSNSHIKRGEKSKKAQKVSQKITFRRYYLTTMVVWARKLSRVECYDPKNLTSLKDRMRKG